MAEAVSMSELLAAAVRVAEAVLDRPDSTPEDLREVESRLRSAVETAHAEARRRVAERFRSAQEAMKDSLALARAVELSFGCRSEDLKYAELAFRRLRNPVDRDSPPPSFTSGGRLDWRETREAVGFHAAHQTVFPLLQYVEAETRISRYGTRTTGMAERLVGVKDVEVWKS